MKRLLFAVPLLLAGCLPQIPGLNAPITPASGGTVALTFSAANGSNADTSNFGAGVQLGGSANNVSFIAPGLKTRQFSMLLGGKPTAGKSYSILKDNPGSGANAGGLIYTEADVTSGSAKGKVWNSTGGTVMVDSVNGSAVSFTLKDVTFAKGGDDDTNGATGTFTVNGTVKADKLSGM
jgi:hypothetical protein